VVSNFVVDTDCLSTSVLRIGPFYARVGILKTDAVLWTDLVEDFFSG
jgi:hypothetical protein